MILSWGDDMSWDLAKDYLQTGEKTRQEQWGKGKFIQVREDVENILIDENGLAYYPDEDDYKASWKLYDDEVEFKDMTPQQQEEIVKNKVLCLYNHRSRLLNNLLYSYAKDNNSIPNWEYKSGIKYYITYSHTADRFMAEGSWRLYCPTITYFSDKKVAEDAILKYEKQLKHIVELEILKGYVNNCHDLSEKLDELNSKIDTLSNQKFLNI